ncbi:MAG: toast rack family protein [Chloroflexota bacterium]
MFRKRFLMLMTVLALASLACSVTVDLPVERATPGPTQEIDIQVEEPDANEADVLLTFGAGELRLSPGADGYLISGSATFNVEEFQPKIKVNGNKVRLETGDFNLNGVPSFKEEIKNKWDLEFGDMPMRLSINAGAYQGNFDLGGLSLKALDISDGAADVRLKFSQRNKVEMETLRYITGASNVRLSELGNANFTSMIFRSGAGDYSLDFSGDWQRDAVVTVESGISNVVIIVPEGQAARVYFKGGLTSVDVRGDWQKSGDQYSLEGNGPVLTINVDMGAGNLQLRTTND